MLQAVWRHRSLERVSLRNEQFRLASVVTPVKPTRSRPWVSLWRAGGVLKLRRARGADDCYVACVDGLKGLPEAIETIFPRTQVQFCIVHKVRNSLRYVPWKERKAVATDLRAIFYAAPTLEAAEIALHAFSERWDEHYPAISPAWPRDWQRLTVFFDYLPAIRKIIYTTNAIESLNYSLRKVLKTKGVFPNDDSIRKILYLAINNISKKWTMPIQNWKQALNHLGADLLKRRIINGLGYFCSIKKC